MASCIFILLFGTLILKYKIETFYYFLVFWTMLVDCNRNQCQILAIPEDIKKSHKRRMYIQIRIPDMSVTWHRNRCVLKRHKSQRLRRFRQWYIALCSIGILNLVKLSCVIFYFNTERRRSKIYKILSAVFGDTKAINIKKITENKRQFLNPK